MTRLFNVSFRAHLVSEGFACPATVITLADTAQEAIETAAKWFVKNQPYFTDSDPRSASLDNFEAVMLPCFFCYGIERPLLWDFPSMPTRRKDHAVAKFFTLFARLAQIPHTFIEKDGEKVHQDCLRCQLELCVTEIQRQVHNQTHYLVQAIDQEIGVIVDDLPKRKVG